MGLEWNALPTWAPSLLAQISTSMLAIPACSSFADGGFQSRQTVGDLHPPQADGFGLNALKEDELPKCPTSDQPHVAAGPAHCS